MIIYIHGFSSSANSTKGQILKDYFEGKEKVLTPGLPEEPYKTMQVLEELIISAKDEKVLLIGSSLGGFYALSLHSKYKNLLTVLINPALYPWEQLKKYVGENINRSNGEAFEWKAEYLVQLEKLNDEMCEKNLDNVMLLLAKDDELIDYKETLELLGETGE
ncbi:MAG: esterase, partial [Ignavibacteriae bacterium]|nr:esterase [Ignavibacteriota bacterium]